MENVDFEMLKANFAEQMLLNEDVLEISFSGSLLRVLVKDEFNPDNLPATFLDDSGYHVGIEYTTPGRLAAMEKHKEIEAAALAADDNPKVPTQVKVANYLASLE